MRAIGAGIFSFGLRFASAESRPVDPALVSDSEPCKRAWAGKLPVAAGPPSKRAAEHVADPASDGPDSLRGFDAFEAKANAAWKLLNDRYGSKLSQVEIDHLHARFVMGLTQPGFGAGPPALHLEACRRLLSRDLPPKRVEAALSDIPPPGEAWVEEAFARIENQGKKIGREISDGHGEGAAAGGDGAARR